MMIPDYHQRTISLDDEILLSDCFSEEAFVDYDKVMLEYENQQFRINSFPLRLQFNVILFCLKGTFNFRCNLTEYQLKENDIAVAAKGAIGECLGYSKDISIGIIAFSNDSFAENTEFERNLAFRKYATDIIKFNIDKGEMQDIVSIYHLMRNKLLDNSFILQKKVLKHYINVISCYFSNWMNDFDQRNPQSRKSHSSLIFGNFLNLVKENFYKQRKIEFYADKLCVTPKYLSQLVFKESKRYAGDWIRDYVILEAKALLKSHQYTVAQVCDELNFPNASFFVKYFKKHVGVTPKKYQDG